MKATVDAVWNSITEATLILHHRAIVAAVMTAATLVAMCFDADALIKTLFPGLVLTPKMKISPEMRWRDQPDWDFMLLYWQTYYLSFFHSAFMVYKKKETNDIAK